ncbi:MAG: hypothetical protein KME26_19085 [Oscillatoria princeps RMCB-10]|nr:hypothetical protein [Oscillatoria princeps RMCB-10]
MPSRSVLGGIAGDLDQPNIPESIPADNLSVKTRDVRRHASPPHEICAGWDAAKIPWLGEPVG